MKKGVLPGTFDPPSLGHVDIIERAAKVCDKLYVAIAPNIEKRRGLFAAEEKKEMLKEITKHLGNIEIVTFNGLIVDFAKTNGVQFLVRGLRAFSDFEHEFRMALANRRLTGIETLFLMADAQYAHISSTLIRELAPYQGRLRGFVPQVLENHIFQKAQNLS
jgi:pantetheine-phosphate adenylyltransferase